MYFEENLENFKSQLLYYVVAALAIGMHGIYLQNFKLKNEIYRPPDDFLSPSAFFLGPLSFSLKDV